MYDGLRVYSMSAPLNKVKQHNCETAGFLVNADWCQELNILEKEQFNLLFAIFKLSVTLIVHYYLGLLSQCSLCFHFKIIFLIYKIHTQRSLFYRYFSLWSTYGFLEDSKPDKSLNCYFKYLFYFLCICSPNSYLTLWIVNPW